MRDLLSWNLSLGRWFGVQVRLHALFLVLALFTYQFCTLQPGENLLWYGSTVVALLFVSVLLHEVGHCIAARWLGSPTDQILIWPLGGLAPTNLAREPQDELLTAAAGPLVNLVVCVLTAPFLWWVGTDIGPLFNPLRPPPALAGFTLAACLELAFWINVTLLLINLMPAFLLDGGRMLRAILWPTLGYRSAVAVVAKVAMATSAALCLFAWLIHDHPEYGFAWAPLVLLAIVLFFNARQETDRRPEQDLDDSVFGYDFSQGYTSLERNFPDAGNDDGPAAASPVKQWLDSRREARLQRQRQQEEEEERRVDEILSRLHERGMGGLSVEERALLQRVSARYRNRQQGSHGG